MPPTKRRRTLEEAEIEGVQSDSTSIDNDDPDGSVGSDGRDSLGGDESTATEDEISEAQKRLKSKKTQKRKRRATSPSHFGATLQTLLNTTTPTSQPLSLKPSVAKKRNDDILEVKAKKLLEGEKKGKEEKNHITDVIGGWGGESERSLRKVAQRGGKFGLNHIARFVPHACSSFILQLSNSSMQFNRRNPLLLLFKRKLKLQEDRGNLHCLLLFST